MTRNTSQVRLKILNYRTLADCNDNFSKGLLQCSMYHLQKVDNCLKFMCDVIKVHTFPTRPESWVITDEIEEIEINSIGDIVSVALTFKATNGQIIPLTQKVFVYFLLLVHCYNTLIRMHIVCNYFPAILSVTF